MNNPSPRIVLHLFYFVGFVLHWRRLCNSRFDGKMPQMSLYVLPTCVIALLHFLTFIWLLRNKFTYVFITLCQFIPNPSKIISISHDIECQNICFIYEAPVRKNNKRIYFANILKIKIIFVVASQSSESLVIKGFKSFHWFRSFKKAFNFSLLVNWGLFY